MQKTSRKSSVRFNKIVYFPVVPILLLLAGINSPLSVAAVIQENKETQKDSIMQDSIVKVKELYDAFKKDETAARKKYSQKNMLLSGFVVYVGPDVYALPSVEISEKKGGKARALCVLPFSDYLKLRKVSKGDEVIVKGEVRGFYEKGDEVIVKECVIEEKK